MERAAEATLQPYRSALTAMLYHLAAEQVVPRLWAGDASLWHPAADTQARIGERLGWLDLPVTVDAAWRTWIDDLGASNYSDVVWITLDAGASARLWLSYGEMRAIRPRLTLLDTYEPATVQERLSDIDPARTTVVCAAFDLTPEIEALCDVVIATLGLADTRDERQFTALTTPGSPLAVWLGERIQFRLVPVRSGLTERFGTLSSLGGNIAALQTSGVERVLAAAQDMRRLCQVETDLRDNPGIWLGSILGVLAQHGRDLLTILAPPSLMPLAEWMSIFVGGSLSKHRRGFVPLVGEPIASSMFVRRDRLFVQLRAGNQQDAAFDATVAGLEQAGQPVLRFDVSTHGAQAAHIVCWQVAVAVAGVILGLNPFDEPDTVALRAAVRHRLHEKQSTEPSGAIAVDDSGLPQVCRQVFVANPVVAYVALVLYLPRTPEVAEQLTTLRAKLGQAGLATFVVEPLRDPLFAAQVLHAGRQQGVILALSRSMEQDPPAPCRRLIEVAEVRAAIDEYAWTRMGRARLHVDLGRDVVEGLAGLAAALAP